MKYIVVMILITLAHTAIGQNLDCLKFKTGHFQNIDSQDGNTFIKRTKKHQIETDISTGVKIKLRIVWESDCTYRLSFVKGNAKWNKENKANSNPDLIVTIIEVGKDYYIQVARFEGLDEFEYRSKIKIVK